MSPSLNHILADKSRIELILDFLPYPFIISQREHGSMVNIYLNKRFAEEIGYTLEDIPTIDAWFAKAYPEPLYRSAIVAGWNSLVNEAIQKGEESALMRAMVRTKYNQDKWYEIKSAVTASLQFVAFVDITEVMTKERELQRLNDNKNQTLSILAHDVRSPLASLNTMTRLMLDGNFDRNEFLSRLTAIHDKSSQVLEFIDTTLHWTRANFNSIVFKSEEVDVHHTVTKILQVYSNIYQAKNLTITMQVNGNRIRTDQEIFTIIVRNLLSNAIKFSHEKGEIVISVQDGIGDFCLSIKDHGVGMSSETLERLQQDQHTSATGTREEKGLGLGLKLCRQLIKMSKGEMKFKSKPGFGTEVIVTLPYSE